MRKLLCCLLFSLPFFTVYSQETKKPCNATFEVNAGPDIDVCEMGTVGLNGILGGNATRGVWRGGKGKFEPGRNALQADYTPDTSEIGNTVVLTFVGDNPDFPDCPKGRDDVQVRVNVQPKVNAGENFKSCQGKPIKLNGKLVAGKAQRLQWISSGAGNFDDASKPDAVYTPLEAGACRLTLKAFAYGVCLNDSDAIALTVIATPVISLPKELIGRELEPVTINGEVKGNAKLSWTTSGNGKFQSSSKPVTTYTPTADDLAQGSVKLTLKAKGEMDCTVEKSVVLNFHTRE